MSANRARGNMAKLFVGVMVLNLIPLLAFAADKAVDAPTWPGKDTKAVESKPAKKPSNKTKGGGVKTVDGKAPEKTPEAPTPSFSSMTLEEMSDPVSGFGGFKVVAIPNADKRDAAREVSLVGMIDRRCAYEKPGESTEAKFSFTQIKELKNGNIGFQLDDKDGSIRKCMKEHPASSCRKDDDCIDIATIRGAKWNLSGISGTKEIQIVHIDPSKPLDNGREQAQSLSPKLIHTGDDILKAQDDEDARQKDRDRIALAESRMLCINTIADVHRAMGEALILKNHGIKNAQEYQDTIAALKKKVIELQFQDLKKQATSAGVDNLALLRDDLQVFAEAHREYSSQIAGLFENLASRAMAIKDFKLTRDLVAEAGNLPELNAATHARLDGDLRSVALAKVQSIAMNGYQNNFMLMPELYATAQTLQQDVMRNCYNAQQNVGMSIAFGSSVTNPVQASQVDNTAQMETCANTMQALRTLYQIPQQAMQVDARQQQIMQSVQASMYPQSQQQQISNPFAPNQGQVQPGGFGAPGAMGPQPLPMGGPQLPGSGPSPMMASNYGGFNPSLGYGNGPMSLYGSYGGGPMMPGYSPMGNPSMGRF